MLIPGLSEALIRGHASPDSYSRGRRYYDEGAVVDLTQRGSVLYGEVEGSDASPYEIQVAFGPSGIASATCTCPYDRGGWCKHIVAVLLTCLYDAEDIEVQPGLEDLLSELDRGQLQSLLLSLAARDPSLADKIERQAALLRLADTPPQPSAPGAPPRPLPVSTDMIRRQVRGIMRSAELSDDDYYDDETDFGADAVHELQPLIARVRQCIESGDGRAALRILEPLTEEYLVGYRAFADEYEERYGYYEGDASNFFDDLGEIWAEALLSIEPAPDELRGWQNKLQGWHDEAADASVSDAFVLAVTAAEQGWAYPPLRRVLAGEVTEQGAWAGEPPDYADELALVRLRILERQGRRQEYLYLAEAEGQLDRYVMMLAKMGRFDEALSEGLQFLETPKEALALAQLLSQLGQPQSALQIAEHGMALPIANRDTAFYGMSGEYPKAELAAWTAELAAGQGEMARALTAAKLAYRASPSLEGYIKALEIAGEQKNSVKAELLQFTRQNRGYSSTSTIDVFLHEQLIDDAIAAVKNGSSDQIRRVMAAAEVVRPDWVIRAACDQAAHIINGGKAQYYDAAVDWMRRARAVYQSLGRMDEWNAYLSSVRQVHSRKHKLMGLLDRI